MNIPPAFDNTQAEKLQLFLSAAERSAETMRYPEAAGFLFVVATAPEMINPSEWLPVIVDPDEFDSSAMDSAQEAIGALMALYNELNRQVQEGDVSLPPGCSFVDEVLDNFEEGASMNQWCRGFMVGQQWIGEMWDEYLPDELDEELGAQLLMLSFFADRKMAESVVAESEEPDRPLGEMAAAMCAYFSQAMSGLARLGHSIQSVLREQAQQPARSEKVGRNEPCPCGSGKKYKKCCGRN